ncbi:MAG: hypothetical protein ABJD53_05980 [Gammaproteobacteria bacterium]
MRTRTCVCKLALLGLILTGCQGQSAPSTASTTVADADPKGAPGGNEKKDATVSLTPQQIKKLGLVSEAAKSAKYSTEIPGFGVVMPHEPIATAVAELVAAQATVRQVHSALARQQRLAGTAGAVSADTLEGSIQQEAVAMAQLHLSEQKLTTLVGQDPPWADSDNAELRKLATGRLKLLRMTFPEDVMSEKLPWQVRAAHIGATQPANSWSTKKIWNAPADATVPGRSFFALLDSRYAAEGERLQVWASTGEAEEGVAVPLAAILMHDSKYWCYLEKEPGTFSRTEVDIDKPTAGGYVVFDRIAKGDRVVVSAVSELLAQETSSGAEPD